MVESLRDPHVGLQGTVLPVARLEGNNSTALEPVAYPTLELAVTLSLKHSNIAVGPLGIGKASSSFLVRGNYVLCYVRMHNTSCTSFFKTLSPPMSL